MLTTLAYSVLSAPSLPHVDIAKFLEADQPVVERYIGHGTKMRKGPGYLFVVNGFDQFWVLGYGKDMTRVVCQISVPCTREQAFGCLGLSDKHATTKSIPIGNAPIATRRNCQELTGVTGLSPDRFTHKPWKVEFEEDGVINRARMDSLKSRIVASTGTDRINLIRQCYDWRPKVSLQQ